MGIYSRYSAAFLILALLSPKAFSAVRVPVIQNDEYIRQVLSRQTASTGAISTPAGQVAFFGADKVFAFSAGDSVRPTVREVTPWIKGQTATTGAVSFPYGPGAAYPTDPNLTPDKVRVNVKPQVVVPKANILKGLKDGLKLNPGQLMLSGAVAAAVGAVGWVMEEGSKPGVLELKKPDPTKPDSVFGLPAHINKPFIGDLGSCSSMSYNPPGFYWPTPNSNQYVYSTSGPYTANGFVYTNNCGSGYTISVRSPQPVEVITAPKASVTESDMAALDPWVSQQSAEWLGGLIRDVCNGSLNPGACYSQMVDRSKGMIQGPALLAGPITTKTTQTPNADGTTKTRTETTKTDFKLTYGKDFFDVETEKKTTVMEDGQLVSETTEKDDTPAQDVADTTPGDEQQPEPEYTFNDSPFPEITPFYEQKYPDGLSGVWNQAKADIDNSNFMLFLSSFVPSFSGSCPSFGMQFAIGNMGNFGSFDFQSLCYVFDFVKIVLLVTAVFAARQLTFGG